MDLGEIWGFVGFGVVSADLERLFFALIRARSSCMKASFVFVSLSHSAAPKAPVPIRFCTRSRSTQWGMLKDDWCGWGHDESYDWSQDWSSYDDSSWHAPDWTLEVPQLALLCHTDHYFLHCHSCLLDNATKHFRNMSQASSCLALTLCGIHQV